MRRDGGWTIELVNPIEGIDKLDIRPPTLKHVVRWGTGEIPSVLALLSELTGVKETQLVDLSGTDSDRVLMALSIMAPPQIKEDFTNQSRPLATPFDALPAEEQYEIQAGENDEQDPRFPKVQGPVKRFKQPPPQEAKPPQDDGAGINMAPPNVARKVG